MTKLKVVPPPPVDQVLYGVARAVALREWHRTPPSEPTSNTSGRRIATASCATRAAAAPDAPE
jgi:hypothetical protein